MERRNLLLVPAFIILAIAVLISQASAASDTVTNTAANTTANSSSGSPATGSPGRSMPPDMNKMKLTTAADRQAAADRAKTAGLGSSQSLVGSMPTVAAALSSPDYFGNTPNYANSPLPVLYPSHDYFWTWYDSVATKNWVIMADPAGCTNRNLGLSIFGSPQTLPNAFGLGAGVIPGGKSLPYTAPGLLGGPVKASTLTGGEAVVSQRSLWKGGNSLEEVLGTDSTKLSDHYYWTWYDNKSPGMYDWVMISNPSANTIYYRIKVAGSVPGAGQTLEGAAEDTILTGASKNARFNLKSGPVEVETFSDAARTIPTEAIASQRVLTNMGTASEAFNEVPGIPAIDLTNDYLWTWYDNVSAGAYDWVMIANPNPYAINYRITVKGAVPGQMIEGDATGTIPQDSNVTPRIKNVLDGPVEVKTCKLAFVGDTCPDGNTTDGKSIASQRTLWGPSFEEVPGYPRTALTSDYHWTWYDQADAGTYDWVHIINTDSVQVNYRITVGGSAPSPVVEGSASSTIAVDGLVHPRFLKRGGPVEVKACKAAFNPGGSCSDPTPAKVMTSQRVLWHGYFNEVLGTKLN